MCVCGLQPVSCSFVVLNHHNSCLSEERENGEVSQSAFLSSCSPEGNKLRSKKALVEYLQKTGETTLKAEDFGFTGPHQRNTRSRAKRCSTKAAGTVLENEDCHSEVRGLSTQNRAEDRAGNIQTGNKHLGDVTSALESKDLVTKGIEPEDCLKTTKKRAGMKSVQNTKTGRSSGKRNRDNTQPKRQKRVCNKQEGQCLQNKRLCRRTDPCVADNRRVNDQNTDPACAGKILVRVSRARSDTQLRSVTAREQRELESLAEQECVETSSDDASSAESEEKTNGLKTGKETDGGSPGTQDVKSDTGMGADVWQHGDEKSFTTVKMPSGICVGLGRILSQCAARASPDCTSKVWQFRSRCFDI